MYVGPNSHVYKLNGAIWPQIGSLPPKPGGLARMQLCLLVICCVHCIASAPVFWYWLFGHSYQCFAVSLFAVLYSFWFMVGSHHVNLVNQEYFIREKLRTFSHAEHFVKVIFLYFWISVYSKKRCTVFSTHFNFIHLETVQNMGN